MTIQELYETIGGNYADASSRLINESMVTRFVKKFPSDPSMHELLEAVAAGDIQTSFRAAHTLKGVCGNLAFTRLFQAAWNLTEQLRPLDMPADPVLLEQLKEEYQLTLNAIERLQ